MEEVQESKWKTNELSSSSLGPNKDSLFFSHSIDTINFIYITIQFGVDHIYIYMNCQRYSILSINSTFSLKVSWLDVSKDQSLHSTHSLSIIQIFFLCSVYGIEHKFWYDEHGQQLSYDFSLSPFLKKSERSWSLSMTGNVHWQHWLFGGGGKPEKKREWNDWLRHGCRDMSPVVCLRHLPDCLFSFLVCVCVCVYVWIHWFGGARMIGRCVLV